MTRFNRTIVPAPVQERCSCGAIGVFGVGPPLQREQKWYCHPCWIWLPTTQDLLAQRCRDALDEGDDA